MEPAKEVDLAFLIDFTKGNRQNVLKYINMFTALAPQCINNIQVALLAPDYHALYTALHTLKPQLQFMGIAKAFKLTEKTEGALRNSPDITPAIQAQSVAICEAVTLALKELELLKKEYA